MTTIFTVSVDSVEGSTLRGRVHVVNPDVPYVPREPAFALSLLVDAWWRLDNGYWHDEEHEGGERCPFSEEEGKEMTTGMRLRDEFPNLFELILGKEIRVTEDGYLLAGDGETVLEPRRKAEDVYELSGGGRPGYSVFTHGDAEDFSQRAAAIVTAYEISPYRNAPHLAEAAVPEDPEELDVWEGLEPEEDHSFAEIPYVEITVTVSDPGYLEHMAAGMRWDTTMTGEVC
ncbi:hypothetical protein O4J56_04375 [Nocardiopsis sp. RSe5-2]|uniref:Uncharacterized protein n=1 Tax=Nocardiopsis endophytica TaxID=3018445 RepID=A0ABT4TYT8_9ACTN|nr:hypothetical protein [Nocardiopsis endophytica]MDA2809866.1 hypothetical protein [Nocardiopsis endophytica]